MKLILLLFLGAFLNILSSCRSKISFPKKTLNEQTTKLEKPNDSIEPEKYRFLKEYAICQCVYEALKIDSIKYNDISPSIYADILNFSGIDTLNLLAKAAATKIKPSTYSDYKNYKPIFFRCNRWADTPVIDSLFRIYAIPVSPDDWIYDTTGK